jgi:hypothetical protein
MTGGERLVRARRRSNLLTDSAIEHNLEIQIVLRPTRGRFGFVLFPSRGALSVRAQQERLFFGYRRVATPAGSCIVESRAKGWVPPDRPNLCRPHTLSGSEVELDSDSVHFLSTNRA